VCFLILNLYYYFGYIGEFLTDVSFHHADKGATHPTKIPTLGHHVDAQVVAATGGIQEVETNLPGLTTSIPPLERENVHNAPTLAGPARPPGLSIVLNFYLSWIDSSISLQEI
jgi:hypothetical protein